MAKSKNIAVGRFVVHKDRKLGFDAKRTALVDMMNDPEMIAPTVISALSKNAIAKALPTVETVPIMGMEELIIVDTPQRACEIEIDYKKEEEEQEVQSNINDRDPISIKTLLALVMADIDIYLLKCPDQETDRRQTFTVRQVRKQLMTTMCKFCDMLELTYDINEQLKARKFILTYDKHFPNKLPDHLKRKYEIDI